MELSDELRCVFSGQVEQRDGSYVIPVPDREVKLESVAKGTAYRVAVLSSGTKEGSTMETDRRQEHAESDNAVPPVDQGDIREVEIEDLGDQGDGLAWIDGGFVVIVPGGKVGDEVEIEIINVAGSYAIGEITDQTDQSL